MKKFTAKDVFEQIDLTGYPHGGEWQFSSEWRFYSEPCVHGKYCDEPTHGVPLLESIAESLSMDGTEVKGVFTVDERKALKEIAMRYVEAEIYGVR